MVMAPIDRRPFPGGPIKPQPMPWPQPQPLPAPGANYDHIYFQLQDKNRDGSLSLDEFLRSKKEITQKDVDTFNRYDRDGDGKLSKEEYVTGRAWDRAIQGLGQGIRKIAQPAIDWKDMLLNAKPN